MAKLYFEYDPVDAYGSAVRVITDVVAYARECGSMGEGDEDNTLALLVQYLGEMDEALDMSEPPKPLTAAQVVEALESREAQIGSFLNDLMDTYDSTGEALTAELCDTAVQAMMQALDSGDSQPLTQWREAHMRAREESNGNG